LGAYWSSGAKIESADIDGEAVANIALYNVPPHPFAGVLQDTNRLGLPAGSYPMAGVGDYLFIDNLSVGDHTIHFHAEWKTLLMNVNYKLAVQ
jgi:hypothetical protein